MKVLLLRTARPRGGKPPYVYPPVAQPLGALQLAACVRRKRPGDEVRVIDASISLPTAEDLGPVLDDFEPDVLGLSAMSYEESLAQSFSDMARKRDPDIVVVAGGPMPTASLDRTLSIPSIDLAVVGEGDETFPELLDALEKEKPPLDVAGVAGRDPDGRPRLGKARGHVAELDDLPPVDWNDIDMSAYAGLLNMNVTPARGLLAILMTTRGCPYRCTYCLRAQGSRVRHWSSRRMGDEMERLVTDHGVAEIHIVDDLFNSRRDRIRELHREVTSRGLAIRFAFPNGLRCDRLSREDIRLLAEAGCDSICLPVETTSERLQRHIRKKLDVEKVFRVAEWCREEDILTQAFVMIGFPTETESEMRETVRRVEAAAIDVIRVFPVVPIPGTELYEEAVQLGFKPEDHPDVFGGETAIVNPTSLPDETYMDVIHWAQSIAFQNPERGRRIRGYFERRGLLDHPMVAGGSHFASAMDRSVDSPGHAH